MSFNVSQNFKAGIDASVLKEVSAEILKRAHAKSGNVKFDVNVKTPSQIKQEQGLNLYNGSVDSNTARQIALNNSGLQIQLNQNVLDSIKFLNSQAAQKSANDLNGRLTIDVNDVSGKVVSPENPTVTQGIVSFATDKDKSGSQPQYRGELLQTEANAEDVKPKNIFE